VPPMKAISSSAVARYVSLGVITLLALGNPTWGLDKSVQAIHGDSSRTTLGDGTGIIIGIVDSGVDDTHPALTGSDSLGHTRLVAKSNFVTTEPGNQGDDVVGHGTWVASTILGNDPNNKYDGMATDARFVNARTIDSINRWANVSWIRNGIGFALGNHADIVNLSLNYYAPMSNGMSQLDMMIDWAASARGTHFAISGGNINQAINDYTHVRGPGSAYNGITVGRTDIDFDQIHHDSATAFTQDGRMKPDLVAPGTSIMMANDDWENQADWSSASGCSFATPHVSGLMAQQLEYGAVNALSTSPLVVKATIVNSTDNGVLDKDGNAWTPANSTLVGPLLSVIAPLDDHVGAGQIDGDKLFRQYSAGKHGAGAIPLVGWDLGSVSNGTSVDYVIKNPLPADVPLTVTLTWFREVTRADDGNGVIDALDFFTADPFGLDDLDLQILYKDAVVAESVSVPDNLEHLSFSTPETGTYTIRVKGDNIGGIGGENVSFGLAWHTVPEPASAGLLAMGIAVSVLTILRPRHILSHLQ
jgi:subtilisin family serine protease